MLCRVEFNCAHVRMLAVIPLLLAVLNVRLTLSASHSSGDEVPPSRICIGNQDDCSDIVVGWRWNKYEKLVAKWSNAVFLTTVEYASSQSGCDVEWDVTINDGGSRIMTVMGKEFEDDTHATWYRINTLIDDDKRPVFNVSLVILSSSCKSDDRTYQVKFYAVNTTIVSSTSTLDRPSTTVFPPTTRTTPGPPSSFTRPSTKGPPSPPSCANNTFVATVGNATVDVLSTTKAVLNASVTAVTEQNNGAIESTVTTASSNQRTVILSSPNILATTETITTVVNPAVRPSSSTWLPASSATARSGQAGGTSVEAVTPTAAVAAITRASSDTLSEDSTVWKLSTGGGELVKSDTVTSSGSRAASSSFPRSATRTTLSSFASRELPTVTPTGKTSLSAERSSGSPAVSPAHGAPSPSPSSQLSPIGERTSIGISTKQSDDARTYTSRTGSSDVASSTLAQHASLASSPSSTVDISSTSVVPSSAAGSTVTTAADRPTVAASVRPSDNVGSSSVSSAGYQSTTSATAAVTSQRTTTRVTSPGPSTVASSSTVTLPTSGSSPRITTTGAESSFRSTQQSASTMLESSSITSRRQEALTSSDNSDNSEEEDSTSSVSTLTRAAPTTTKEQVVRQSTPETPTSSRSVDIATTAGSDAKTSPGTTSAESSSAPSTSTTLIDDSVTTVTIASGLAPYTVSVVDVEHATKTSLRFTNAKPSFAQESATSVTGSSRDDFTSVGKMTSEHSTSVVTTNDTQLMTSILIRFRILNMEFEADLSDVNSPAYNALKMKLSLLLMEVYRVGVGSMFFNISNMEFTEGSVKVQHSLLLGGSMDEGMLNRTQSALQRTLARSNMTVDSFVMKPISPPVPTALSKPPPTTDNILLISLVCGLLAVLVACIIAVTILVCRQRARRRRRSKSSRGSGTTCSDSSSESSSEHVRPPNFSGTALPRVDAHVWMNNNTIRGMGLDRPAPTTSNYFERPTRLSRVLDDDNYYDELPISISNKNPNWQQLKTNKQRQHRQAVVDSLRHNKHRLGDQHVASVEQASNSMVPSDRQHAEVDQDWRFAGGFGGNWGYFDGSLQQQQQQQTSQQPQQAADHRPANFYGRKLWKPPGYISHRAFGDVNPTTGAGDHQLSAPSQDSAELRRRESASQTDSEILVEIDAIYGQRYTQSRDRNRARQQARVSRVSAANGAIRPAGIGRSLHTNSAQGNQIDVYGMRQQAASPTNSRQPDMLHRDVYLP